MKLSSFGSRYALAFALAIAGAVAACGGDDDDGMTTGAGGSGGANPDGGRGGVAEAGPDRAPDRAATGGAAGTGGTDSSAGGAAGAGGARPDAAEAAPGTGGSPEAAPDVTRPPEAGPDVPAVPETGPDVRSDVVDAGPDVAREAEAGPVPGSDATDVTPAVEAAPDVREAAPVVEAAPEAAPFIDAGSDAGAQVLYSFEVNNASVMDWRVDLDPDLPTAVTFLTGGGAPGSTAGAIEFNGSLSETHSVYVDFSTDPPVGLGEGSTRSYPGFTGVSAQVRLRNALDGGTFDNLNNIQLVLVGGAASGFATCLGAPNVTEILGGDWVTLTVSNCTAGDAGFSALTDLQRIAVEVNVAQNDASAMPIVLNVDNVVLTP